MWPNISQQSPRNHHHALNIYYIMFHPLRLIWCVIVCFLLFPNQQRQLVHRYNMKVSDSQNSWKLMAIEFWSCYSLGVLSSTVLQHITLVRRRHYQRELMTGGISWNFPGTSDPTMWFQKSPKKWPGKRKPAVNYYGDLLKVEKTMKNWQVGGFNPFEKYESNWMISPNRGEHKKYLKPPTSWGWTHLNADGNSLIDPHQFPPNFSKIGLRLRSRQTVATPEKKWGRSAAS